MPEIKRGVVVFATEDCRSGVADARAWLAAKGMTKDDVRLYRLGGMVLIETLRPVFIKTT